MKNKIFPKYDITKIKQSFFVSISDKIVEIEKVSLEEISVLYNDKSVEKDLEVKVNFKSTEITFMGEIIHFFYARDLKKYRYDIRVNFQDKKNFLKWLAIIKGVHRARFKS